MRMTKNRKKILNVFKQTSKPLSAEDINQYLGEFSIDISTIYRTLEYFDSNNLLLKFHLNNKSYYYLNTKDHHHYFICTNCLNMYEVECNLKSTINELENENKFIITNHEMNFYGLCNLCQ